MSSAAPDLISLHGDRESREHWMGHGVRGDFDQTAFSQVNHFLMRKSAMSWTPD